MLRDSTVVAIPLWDSRAVSAVASIPLQDLPNHQSLLWSTQILAKSKGAFAGVTPDLALSGDQSQPEGFRSDVEMVGIPIVVVI